MTLLTRLNCCQNICVTNDHQYVPFVVNTILPFPYSWLATRYVTRVTWQVLLVEQELLAIQEFTTVFCEVHVAQLLVFCEVFCRSFCLFFLFSIITLTGYIVGINVREYWREIKNGQSRETGNIRVHKTKTNKTKTQ